MLDQSCIKNGSFNSFTGNEWERKIEKIHRGTELDQLNELAVEIADHIEDNDLRASFLKSLECREMKNKNMMRYRIKMQ